MNDGILTGILIIISIILTWSGWFDHFFMHYKIKKWLAYLLYAIILLPSGTWFISERVYLNPIGLIQVLTLLPFLLYFSRSEQVLMLSTAIFMGSLVFISLIFLIYVPVLHWWFPMPYTLALGLSMIVAFLTRDLAIGLWVTVAALTLGYFLCDWHQWSHLGSLQLFSTVWQDTVWLSMYALLFIHLISRGLLLLIRKINPPMHQLAQVLFRFYKELIRM